MAYNLAAIRKLLTDAFSSGSIQTLAFDLFPEVYDDFAVGMTKSQMVEAVVIYAEKNGRFPHLLAYVQKENPYQYNRYAPQLETTQSVPRVVFGDEQRLQDLERNIQRSIALLNQYEERRVIEDDPRRLLKIDHEINREKKTIAGYREEVAQIQGALPAVADADDGAAQTEWADITQRLADLSQQLDGVETRLAAGQDEIRQDIRQQQAAILAHIDGQHRQTIAVLVEKMDADQLELTELMLDAADQQQIAQWQAEQLTLLTQQALVDLKRLRQDQPDTAQWDNILDALASQTGWQQKLKLTVPLVPGILEFESEMGMDVVPALKQAWNTLAAKIRS